jgi:prepilin-type N-terminal cleavage/methylation domain-containing protein
MKSSKAFTLIEVLVTTFIASIVFLGVITAIAQSNRLLNETVVHTMAQSDMNQFLYDVANDIKQGIALKSSDPYNKSEKMAIVCRDSTLGKMIVWTNMLDKESNAYVPVRIAQNGTQRWYRMKSSSRKISEKSFKPYYYVNCDPTFPGTPAIPAYHKAIIRIDYIDPDLNYSSVQKVEANFSCKQRASGYGY